MELSSQQVDQVIDYLKKWKTAQCGICGYDDWVVASTVFVLHEYTSLEPTGFYGSTESVFPVIPLTCKTCGNVLFLSAVAAGVVPAIKAPK